MAYWILLWSVLVFPGDEAARRGYDHLLHRPYVPSNLDDEVMAEIWRQWPEPLRSRAAAADDAERRRMAYERYGLTPRPGDDSERPLQFVVDADGRWTPNCFTCHGGKVAGTVIPGLPNSHYALETLTEEARATKIALGKPLASIDYGSLVMPLGGTNGTTNAVIFGLALGARRNPDLSMRLFPKSQPLVHHDMDAPPWWHFRKRDWLYLDGFAPKGHRALMQFALDRQNPREKFLEWEDDFRDIYAYLESLEPPRYPFAIDAGLAERGRVVFESHCAECHGTYGAEATYPHRIVPIGELGTDRARLDAMSEGDRLSYQASWFGHNGDHRVQSDPGGYMAPPLDGVWASAPYLHNGSVPTLWHMLHPDDRPIVWRRSIDGYDAQRVGLEVDIMDAVPAGVATSAERRSYFDTRRFGKSRHGHRFPDALDESERRAVLEYLKTL